MILRISMAAMLLTLFALPGASRLEAAPATISGQVVDSSGAPQAGAVVQLLRPDLSVQATVHTDNAGRYAIESVQPGRYSLKAMGASFLPTLREGLRLRSKLVANLTLNTLFEVMQWLPAQPRAASSHSDDWKWTLRSASNRPLLRWLEDGPLVVVSDGEGHRPRLKARLTATGEAGSFGESGERFTAALEQTHPGDSSLLAQVNFAPDSNAGLNSRLGFRQELGYTGAVQSLAEISLQPEILSPEGQGLTEGRIGAFETIDLGEALAIEAGSALAAASIARGETVSAVLPFAQASWRSGGTELRYRFATALPSGAEEDYTRAASGRPRLAMRGGALSLERGLHHELGWRRSSARREASLALFADRLENPVVQFQGSQGLSDPRSGLARLAGPSYSSTGFAVGFGQNLHNLLWARLSYANGEALALPVELWRRAALEQLVAAARPRRTQSLALSLSGTVEGTGAHWRASYRWQPDDTLADVAPFLAGGAEPYLSVHLRQPLGREAEGNRVDLLLDLRNLLAEGYAPAPLSDGSVLVFTRAPRSVGAGLAFTF